LRSDAGKKGTAAISCSKSEINLSLADETIYPFRKPDRGVSASTGLSRQQKHEEESSVENLL
jgi:hypothetical protein